MAGESRKTGVELKKYAEDSGLRFPQGHLKLNADICAEDSERVIDELKRWLDLFLALGIESAVLHGGGKSGDLNDELFERRVGSLSKLADYIKSTPLVICIENLYRNHTTQSSGSILRLLDTVGSDGLGVCLDTGHLNISKAEGQRDFIVKAASRLKALHIADNQGVTDEHMMPYGKGNVPWPEVLSGLRDIGYSGAFNFEIPGETQNVPVEILRSKLIHIKNIAKFMSDEMLRQEVY